MYAVLDDRFRSWWHRAISSFVLVDSFVDPADKILVRQICWVGSDSRLPGSLQFWKTHDFASEQINESTLVGSSDFRTLVTRAG